MKRTDADKLLTFIGENPTPFHVVENVKNRLETNGYLRLHEHGNWELRPGGRYYLTRNQSSLIAFRIPEKLGGFVVGAAHTDSPCLKLKDKAEIMLEGCTRLEVEKYGGGILRSFMDRPLSAAGRVLIDTEDGIRSELFNLDRNLMVAPSLAIHMDRDVNTNGKVSVAGDLYPLLGLGDADILELVAKACRTKKDRILGQDIYIYVRTEGTRAGTDGELLMSPRLDDQACVFGLTEGFLRSSPARESMPVLALFDSEEIGSETRQGAMSTFLFDTLRRVCLTLGMGEIGYLRAVAGSLMVSADNAHAVHPSHPEKASQTNRPRMGEGVVVKFGPRYATSGSSAALLRKILGPIPVQSYYNHSDIAGGGTLGNLSGTQVSMQCVDIGIAQLAMHSACETCSAEDVNTLVKGMERVFAASVREVSDGTYVLA